VKLFNIFKKRTIEDVALKLGIKKVPSEAHLNVYKSELMADLFFGVFEDLARKQKEDQIDYSWTLVDHNLQFTAYGAFLHRRDICADLFDLGSYPNNKVLATSGLTDGLKVDDRSEILDAAALRLFKYGQDINELEACDLDSLEMDDPKLYYAMYVQLIFVLHTYMFKVPDLTYITRNLALAIFKCIAICEKSNAERLKPALSPAHEDLVEAVIECTFPLSLNTFNELRNGVPSRIRSRMHQINYKVKKLNTGDYVSPLQRRRQKDGKL
jgi:hypothetical protein